MTALPDPWQLEQPLQHLGCCKTERKVRERLAFKATVNTTTFLPHCSPQLPTPITLLLTNYGTISAEK